MKQLNRDEYLLVYVHGVGMVFTFCTRNICLVKKIDIVGQSIFYHENLMKQTIYLQL